LLLISLLALEFAKCCSMSGNRYKLITLYQLSSRIRDLVPFLRMSSANHLPHPVYDSHSTTALAHSILLTFMALGVALCCIYFASSLTFVFSEYQDRVQVGLGSFDALYAASCSWKQPTSHMCQSWIGRLHAANSVSHSDADRLTTRMRQNGGQRSRETYN
jgi:hypothetical protein